MSDKNPPSRPALRKSVDAALHPALAGRPAHHPPAIKPGPTTPALGKKPLAKAKRAPTSDVLRPTKHDPAVKLTVSIPKSLRKRLRVLAKEQGLDVEQYAARLIADALNKR